MVYLNGLVVGLPQKNDYAWMPFLLICYIEHASAIRAHITQVTFVALATRAALRHANEMLALA